MITLLIYKVYKIKNSGENLFQHVSVVKRLTH